MLFQLTRTALESTIRQWRVVRRTFDVLRRDLERNQKPGTPDPRIAQLDAFQKVCDAETEAKAGPNGADGRLLKLLNTWKKTPPNLLVAQFTQVRNTLLDSEAARATALEGPFNTAFPDAALDPADVNAGVSASREQIEDLGAFIRDRVEDLHEISSVAGERANLRGLRGAVEDISSFPLLTADAYSGPAAGPAAGGGAVTALRRQVDVTIREVLGRTPRRQDPRSFVAALNRSFDVYTRDGVNVYDWTPRAYSGQSELGGLLSGGQASLYTRAAVILDNVLPLLDGLNPLDPNADPENADAIRAVVRTDLTELVAELKTEGGPRRKRVDRFFVMLLGPAAGVDPITDKYSGHLRQLQQTFGMADQFVNTLEEEAVRSDYVAVRDYIFSLFQSWQAFLAGGEDDLGIRLVRLSQSLSVAAEAVGEVYAAMDSVSVGPAERQVASFLSDDGTPVRVEELLSWVLSFTTEEAPRLVQEGGRIGVTAVVPTVELLEDLVEQFVAVLPTEPTLPAGLRHLRVRRPLDELSGYLAQVRQQAEDVRSPLTAGQP